MRLLGALLVAGLSFGSSGLRAEPPEALIQVCFNYSCLSRWPVVFDEQRLAVVLLALGRATNPEEERTRLAMAVGSLYRLAAEQTPIGRDRGGNYADNGVFGRMDCIDHSTTTTGFLRLLEARGGLRWHRVLEPVKRTRVLIFEHYSALIEEIDGEAGAAGAPRYVVDSWFVDNGRPAVIMPLAAWDQGDGPDVE